MGAQLHVVSLPHTQTTSDYLTCAYTQKLVRFGKMMRPFGYDVILYSGEHNEAECDEHVPLLTERERLEWYEPRDPNDANFGGVNWDPNHPSWLTWNGRAISEIAQRWQPRDIVCLSMGCCHQMIADTLQNRLPQFTTCEPGVGYEGISSKYRAFESYAWMHYIYGKQGIVNGLFYDAVIPNYFDQDDFPSVETTPGDYLLFVGRVVQRKGILEAALIAERAGKKLLVAGPGVKEYEPGRIVSQESDYEVTGPVEYVGVLNAKERNELMAGAAALLAPTIYIEPFGGVAVEAMMAGCPVIATDYGAFVETVEDGVTGFRFHTLAEGAAAVDRVTQLDRAAIRERALSRYSLPAVGQKFDRWFTQLDGLWGQGWGA